MARKQYTLSFDKAQESEKIVRTFLLENSNIVRLTEISWTEIGFFKIKRFGGEKDRKFVETLEKLEPFFLKKITNNKRFDDIEQGKKSRFNHYYYRLSPILKSSINKQTLIWNSFPPCSEILIFYGFEDLTFYKDDEMIGSVITHEPIIILHLTEPEKKKLEKQGVVFDKNS
jgi:hypothetical protein